MAGNEWSEMAQLVISELKRLSGEVEALDRKVDEMNRNQGRLEVELTRSMAVAKDMGRLEQQLLNQERAHNASQKKLWERIESLEKKATAGKAYVAGAIAATSVLWGLFLFWLEKVR